MNSVRENQNFSRKFKLKGFCSTMISGKVVLVRNVCVNAKCIFIRINIFYLIGRQKGMVDTIDRVGRSTVSEHNPNTIPNT